MTPDEENTLCRHCKIAPSEPGYQAPLCSTCRDRFVAHPIPAWLKIAVALIAMASAYSMLRFPAVWRLAMVYKHGQAEEAEGHFASAAAKYEQVVAVYPEAEEVRRHLGVVSHETGNDRRAREMLPFSTKPMPPRRRTRDVKEEIDQISRFQPGDEPGTPP